MASQGGAVVLEDVVILGRAVPEELNDGRRTICTGAWSEHQGFIRLYPITEPGLFKRWDILDVRVKRNPQDTRNESWKLATRNQRECVTKTGEYPRENRATLLHNLTDPCVNYINDQQRSLGIIEPQRDLHVELHPWGDDKDTVQSRLFEDTNEWRPDTRDEFDQEIRVEFTCNNCQTKQGYHNKTLLEWGAYLTQSKHGVSSGDELAGFYHISEHDYRHWVFVGNQANQRTSFIAINLVWVKDDVGVIDSPFDNTNYRKVADDFVKTR